MARRQKKRFYGSVTPTTPDQAERARKIPGLTVKEPDLATMFNEAGRGPAGIRPTMSQPTAPVQPQGAGSMGERGTRGEWTAAEQRIGAMISPEAQRQIDQEERLRSAAGRSKLAAGRSKLASEYFKTPSRQEIGIMFGLQPSQATKLDRATAQVMKDLKREQERTRQMEAQEVAKEEALAAEERGRKHEAYIAGIGPTIRGKTARDVAGITTKGAADLDVQKGKRDLEKQERELQSRKDMQKTAIDAKRQAAIEAGENVNTPQYHIKQDEESKQNIKMLDAQGKVKDAAALRDLRADMLREHYEARAGLAGIQETGKGSLEGAREVPPVPSLEELSAGQGLQTTTPQVNGSAGEQGPQQEVTKFDKNNNGRLDPSEQTNRDNYNRAIARLKDPRIDEAMKIELKKKYIQPFEKALTPSS